MSQIRDVFKNGLQHFKVDSSLFKEICALEVKFVCKNQQHIEFFGGNLTGVQTVRFTSQDRDALFIDIFEVDEQEIQEALYSLTTPDENGRPVPVINQEWVVTSDVFNIASIYLIHAIHNSKHLSAAEREEGKIRVALYLYYKFFTSLLFHYFRFAANEEIARAAYSKLTNKFTLKRLGSWSACLRDLASKAVANDGIWSDVISHMDSDQRVLRMIADMQGRIRDMLINIYKVFKECHVKGERIASSQQSVEIDGETILKDKTKSLLKYNRYLNSVISDKNTFIRQELVDVIVSTMPTMEPRHLMQSLTWASNNANHTHDKIVESCTELILEHAYEYLQANRQLVRASKDIPGLLARLRGAYTSSRSVEPKLFVLRDKVGKLVTMATGSRNESAVSAARTGFMLYICLRAWTMQHYSNR